MKDKKNIFLIGIALLGLIITLSFIFAPKDKAKANFLNKYHLNNKSVEEITTYLDSVLDENEGFFASITGKSLTLGDKTTEIRLDVPNNKFYLSFAPYINNTHPCANHNLVTCRGELKQKTMHVLIKDQQGKVIINDEYTSFENGFIGIWLPSNLTGTITVTYNGLTATSALNTSRNSNTCLTTLKLV